MRWRWAPGRVFLYEHGLLFAGRHYGWGELDAVQMGLERAEELHAEPGGALELYTSGTYQADLVLIGSYRPPLGPVGSWRTRSRSAVSRTAPRSGW